MSLKPELKAQRIIYLITGAVRKTLTPSELEELRVWISESKKNQLLFNQLQITPINTAIKNWKPEHTEARLSRLQGKITYRKKIRKLMIYGSAAAMLFLSLAIYLFSNPFNPAKDQLAAVYPQIHPGKTGAILTLGNGRKIHLADLSGNALVAASGITVTKNAKGQLLYQLSNSASPEEEYNTLQTGKGEEAQVILPDQTIVYLNAATTIKYRANYSGVAQRHVQLSGEAYFEVFKDPDHPFIVNTKNQEVKVLGTHFNINGYADETRVKTTLLEGSVNVSVSENPQNSPLVITQAILKPGQQSVVTLNQPIRVEAASVEREMAWKNGYFRFENDGIETVMNSIARWYNIDVKYEGEMPAERFYGTISRSKGITEVLKMLEQTKGVKFTINERRITVLKNY